MICPIMSHTVKVSKDKVTVELANCLEGRCAWWNEGFRRCHFVELVNSLEMIAFNLREIKEKMPHAGQFVK